MRCRLKRLIGILLLILPVPAWTQQSPPPPAPCGEKGVPYTVPCYDVKSGKLLHTNSPPFVPSEPLTEHQKAILNGTAPNPQPPATPAPGSLSPQPPASKAPGVTTTSTPVFQPRPETTTDVPGTTSRHDRESEDAEWARIRAEKQREAQAGAVLGSAIGLGIGNAIYNRRLKHEIDKACFEKHVKAWRLPEGDVIDCSVWQLYPRDKKGHAKVNLGTVVRRTMVERDAANDARAEAEFAAKTSQESYTLMEALRRDIMQFPSVPDTSQYKPVLDQARSSWSDMQREYCKYTPRGKYTDLDGKEQYCN